MKLYGDQQINPQVMMNRPIDIQLETASNE